MRIWRCGGGKEGSEEGEGPAMRVDCGSGYKHQWSKYSICVVHIPGRVAPGVITQSSQANVLFFHGL